MLVYTHLNMYLELLIDLSDFPDSNYVSVYDIEEQNKKDFVNFIEQQIMKKLEDRFNELNNKILEQQRIIDKLTNENNLLERKIENIFDKSQKNRNIIPYGYYNNKEFIHQVIIIVYI